jgi:uncharacterized cupredoxin-like copper-binding protein
MNTISEHLVGDDVTIPTSYFEGAKMAKSQENRSNPRAMPIGLKIALTVAVGALFFTGFSTFSHSGRGMRGANSQYYSSSVSCTTPTNLPGRIMNVEVGDMGMSQMMGGDAQLGGFMRLRSHPTTLPAGKVTVVVTNFGWRTHELVILPLATGQSAGQRVPGPDGKIDETGSIGEASKSCGAEVGEGITAGSAGWTTLTLAPGRYEFLCNLKNHYANGMYQEILVTV